MWSNDLGSLYAQRRFHVDSLVVSTLLPQEVEDVEELLVVTVA